MEYMATINWWEFNSHQFLVNYLIISIFMFIIPNIITKNFT